MSQHKQESSKALESALETGTQPYISAPRLEANRWQVKQKLRAYQSKKRGPLMLFPQFLLARKAAVLAMSLTFVLGYTLALFNPVEDFSTWPSGQQLAADPSLSNTQITDLTIRPASQGQKVKLNYTSVTQTQMDTSLSNEKTLALLSLALKDSLPDETRLKLAQLLKNHLDRRSVVNSLSFSLLNDPNPGVRMVAAESLVQLASQDEVRNTLRNALAKDTNPGVRVSVFNALIQYLDDPKTIKVLQNKAIKDSNLYIRTKTKELIKTKRHQQII